jgi:glycine reductase
MLRIDGAVMTWVGDGQSGIDVMMMCQKIEQAGIKTTVLSPEMARTPEDPGFVHYVDEANAIVSTGNYEMALDLPVPETVLGGKSLTTPKMDAKGPMILTVRYLYDAVSPLGFGRLAGKQY